jgi:uncharacterized protein involved in type VI secretion and phage assembly
MNDNAKLYGKFRGVVMSNVDPMRLGRLQASVPDVHGSGTSTWAMPCVPFAGRQMGSYAVPPVGANVWIEFEQGDIDYPIWTGCFWGSQSELPQPAQAATPGLSTVVFRTTVGNGLTISDMPGPTGGITLEIASGAKITINETGITLSNGQGASVTLAGSTVSVNQTALTVT